MGHISQARQVDIIPEADAQSGEQSAAATIVSSVPGNIQHHPNPGDDFYLFANQSWLSEVEIRTDSLSAGAVDDARRRTETDIARIEMDLLAGIWPAGSAERKYQILYNAFLDERRAERLGLSPIRDGLRGIRQARTHSQIAVLLGNYSLNAGGLFDVTLKVNQHAGQAYVPTLAPARPLFGLADLYLREDAHAVAMREQGAELLVYLLRQGPSRFNARARVDAVLRLETRLARLAPVANAERDPTRNQRLVSREDLAELAPRFPWANYLASQGLGGHIQLGLAPFGDLNAVAEVFAETPVSVWRDYLRLRLMIRFGRYLSEDIAVVTERLGQLRAATPRPVPSRQERASHFAQWILPDLLTRKYAQSHLTPETIDAVEDMAEQIRSIYRQRISAADWLGPQTRAAALEKLDSLQFMIGVPPDWNAYPADRWANTDIFAYAYDKLLSRHLSNLARYRERPPEGGRDIEALRRNIFFSPVQVGAYYLPRLNAVILPAAYLQPPFFDPDADLAQNYGALGTTIGHEIGHAFDDQGSQYGPTGAFENWWSPQDRARFNDLARRLSSQFAGFEAAPGVPLDPQLTLGENLSDLAGLETALDALLAISAQAGKPMTEEVRRATLQTFFLSYADKRRRIRRPETDRQFAPRDRHSPPHLRTNIILSNIDAWYEAFGVRERHALWRPPEARLSLWSQDD
jgi:predicted metalloendopeptidase